MSRLIAGAVVLAATAAFPGAASADLGPDGTTAPTYSYQDATRERVYIRQPGIDQDGDGTDDRIAIEIAIRRSPAPG